jgi:hypothetical protein
VSTNAPGGATRVVNGKETTNPKERSMKTTPTPGAKKTPPRRRRNGLEGMVNLVLPLLVGGGIGYLEAEASKTSALPKDHKDKHWYGKIDDRVKAVVFAAAGYVAQQRGMREAAGAAAALCGIYVAKAGVAYMDAREAEKNKATGRGGKGALGGVLASTGLTLQDVDRDLRAALEDARAQEAANPTPVGELERDALGEVSTDDLAALYT